MWLRFMRWVTNGNRNADAVGVVRERVEVRLVRAPGGLEPFRALQAEQIPVEGNRRNPVAARGIAVWRRAGGDHEVRAGDRLHRSVRGVQQVAIEDRRL